MFRNKQLFNISTTNKHVTQQTINYIGKKTEVL